MCLYVYLKKQKWYNNILKRKKNTRSGCAEMLWRKKKATGTLRFQCRSGQPETLCLLWQKPGWFPAWATFHNLFMYITAWLHAFMTVIPFKRHLCGFFVRNFKRWMVCRLLEPTVLRQGIYTLNFPVLLIWNSLIYMCSSKNFMCIVKAEEMVETWQKICSPKCNW